jgi:hypothetical protein
MTVDHHIDDEHRIVILTLTGALTDADLLGLREVIEKIPGMTSDMSLLFDLRFASGLKITTEGVRRMATGPLAFPPGVRRAVVVPSLLGFGLARMYEALRGEGAPRVFKDYDDAYQWLKSGGAA